MSKPTDLSVNLIKNIFTEASRIVFDQISEHHRSVTLTHKNASHGDGPSGRCVSSYTAVIRLLSIFLPRYLQGGFPPQKIIKVITINNCYRSELFIAIMTAASTHLQALNTFYVVCPETWVLLMSFISNPHDEREEGSYQYSFCHRKS